MEVLNLLRMVLGAGVRRVFQAQKRKPIRIIPVITGKYRADSAQKGIFSRLEEIRMPKKT